jgi:hypothetical protein
MKLSDFPEHIIEQYDLRQKEKNGFVYIEIRRAIYMACHNPAALRTITSEKNCGLPDTMRYNIPQACGNT